MIYNTQRRKDNKLLNIAVAVFWLLALVAILIMSEAKKVHAQAEPLLAPTYYVYSPQETVEKISLSKPNRSEVQSYLKEIFGKEWKMAWAVSQAECNFARPEWPKCRLSWKKEHSIGMFQINVAQNGGVGLKVHWDKIPGETLAEKETWLEDWKNNILMAFKISEGGKNWNPWTGFTSGNYKEHL